MRLRYVVAALATLTIALSVVPTASASGASTGKISTKDTSHDVATRRPTPAGPTSTIYEFKTNSNGIAAGSELVRTSTGEVYLAALTEPWQRPV